MTGVTGEHYESGHWLGTFAVYLESGRGMPVPAPRDGSEANVAQLKTN